MADSVALAAQFQDALIAGCDECWRACRYNPGYFRRMVLEHGGVQAAKQLIRTEQLSEGLTTLWECGRLDLSLEAEMLRPPWKPLFTAEELVIAENRLRDLNYRPSYG